MTFPTSDPVPVLVPRTVVSPPSSRPATPRTPALGGVRRGPAFALGLSMSLALAVVAADPADANANAGAGAGADADYARDLKPLLRERCYACHGALKQKAGLRVDTVEAMRRGGESGSLFDVADPDASLVLQRVGTADPAERMPPEHEGSPLSAEQRSRMRAWIAAGAPAPDAEQPETDPKDHWAFRSPVRPPLPGVRNATWGLNPIDRFIASQHEAFGLSPTPEVPRALLVRRLFLDLVGVPPSLEERAALEADSGPGGYERLVERLLADPRHGERWARHWMDVWRYSDAWGLGDQLRNSQPHIWHWRDRIRESIDGDLPYDEMIRLMLAADELHPTDPERLRATGYLARNYFLFNRHQWLEETVEHVGKGFLGLTLNCAKCHDHKYDPFPQADFYRFRAFFEPYHVRLDVLPGEPDLARDGLPRAFDRDPATPTHRFVRGQESAPDTSVVIAPGVPGLLAFGDLEIRPVALPPEAWQPERQPWVLDTHLAAARAAVESARQRRDHARAIPPAEGVPGDTAVLDAAWIAACAELESVEKRALAMRVGWDRGAGEAAKTAGAGVDVVELRRAAVAADRKAAAARAARAVADAEARLGKAGADRKEAVAKEVETARAALVKAQETATSPPGAGDGFTPLRGAQWTPTRFLDSTRDDPAVDFPPTSTGRRTALASWIADRRNPLTARVAVNQVWMRHLGAPLVPAVFDLGRKNPPPTHPGLLDWLACEFMEHGWSLKHLHRLIVTSATYRMGSSLVGAGGNLAKDPDNLRWWRRIPVRIEAQAVRDAILTHAGTLDTAQGGPPVPPGAQADSRRRSLYFQHSNNDRNPFLVTFDDATVKDCYRREQSIVPQQALALLNSRLVQESAAPIARRLARAHPALGPGPEDDPGFVRRAFLDLLGFEPGGAEMDAALDALRGWAGRASSAAGPASPTSTAPLPEGRAHLVWALLNHNDFVTLR